MIITNIINVLYDSNKYNKDLWVLTKFINKYVNKYTKKL